jgi:hypothetical protein
MPSIDEAMLLELYNSGKIMLFAEQNNGYLWQNFLKVLYRNRRSVAGSLDQIVTVNTLTKDGRAQFIHSATYEELVEAFGLTPQHIAKSAQDALSARL